MAVELLMLLWKDQGILARPSTKILAESLYEKYLSDYHHLQCPTAGLIVVQVRSNHLV